MRLLNKIKTFFIYAYAAVIVFFTAIMCGIDQENETKYRKKTSKKLVNLIADEIEIIGKLDESANLLIGNHTHNMDIPLMESIIDEKIIWVAKKELGEIPVLKNLLTKSDMILIDRNDKRSAIKLIKEVKKRVKNNQKVVIFPEGTRNKVDYKKLQNFKIGPKMLAEKLNLKVQPFVILNLPKAFEDGVIKKVKLKVVFLDSFYPYDGWWDDVKKRMQEILDKEYQ